MYRTSKGVETKKPTDDVLKAHLLKYQEQAQSQEQKCRSLTDDLGYSIRKRRFKPAEEVVKQAIITEVEGDLSRRNGPDYIQDNLRHKYNLHVGRDEQSYSSVYFPEDFVKRFPGRRLIRQNRTQLQSIGPYRWNGHEKLTALAVKMGELGISIYGYKDRWSDNLLYLVCVPESRSAAAGGHIFLDFVTEVGCIPIQLTTDKGPEIGFQHAFMAALREAYAPDLDATVYPPHVILKSTNDTPIEGIWRRFSQKVGANLKEIILRGKVEYIFDSTRHEHILLFYWIFIPLVQDELVNFQRWWNNHRVRTQENKMMPSGHIPSFALEYPSILNGVDCRIEVPKEAIARLREFLEEETNKSREEFFRWYPDDFAKAASSTWEAIGKPVIRLETAWDVFSQMMPLIS
ncbi:hypothetical protein C8J55DRAFT_533979 [Lentinula edodes]|uniref:Integrase core domain-containing protein n=1 Tax=Lentinula lateritia TaxID=40482 RepID=A0A9W9AY71_9AGAR|nr:hypothetical protein C8J55DRAFT_533979 [Lentinula edodes]